MVGDEVLLARAGIIRSPAGAMSSFSIGYARSLAKGPLGNLPSGLGPGIGELEVSIGRRAFTQSIPYVDKFGKAQTEIFSIVGGQTRLQSAKRYLFGYGTTLAERINQLARAPFEMEPFASVMKKAPFLRNLGLSVVPSSGLRTIGKITAKLGILGTLGYYAWQTLDKHARDFSLLDNTIFSEGLNVGFATAWTKAQVGISKLAEITGAHTLREKQEETAPGSTELSKLLAFPILGGLGALGLSYAERVHRQYQFQSKSGLSLEQASIASSLRGAAVKESLYGRAIPNILMTGAEEKTLQLVRKDATNFLGGLEGRLFKNIARAQEGTGFFNKVLRKLGELTPGKGRVIAGALLGTALIAPFLPGALAPSQRPEELERIYSGEQHIPIMKGRWWEFSRSPWEGNRIDYYRASWFPRLLSRAKEKSIWGENAPGPLEKWWIENTTYELEKKHYYDRPFPISSSALEDIPFIGPLLAGTIGRLIKPPVLMHTDEWMKPGGTGTGQGIGEDQYARMPLRFGERTEIPELGETGPGAPISPYSAKGLIGEQVYRLTEQIGLPGFTMTSIKEAITGEQDLFAQEQQLESARRMFGSERDYWDLNIGGGLSTTELVRRLYPHRRRQIPLYNPIRNTMPTWLPGPGSRSIDFLHGDPMSNIPEGELRLPGPGYVALNPELEGVAPEDYPLKHRFAILAGVAPYTDEYKHTLGEVRGAIASGEFNKEEVALIREIQRQVAEKKTKKRFSPYKYGEDTPTPFARLLDAQRGSVEREPSMLGRYWEKLAHNAETPLEYLTPVSPASKLVHMRTAIEDYDRTQLHGSENSFWQHPIRDFFTPAWESLKYSMGFEGIPDRVKQQRSIEEYFDTLKYVKYTRLKRAAQAEGDKEAVVETEGKRRETLLGVNPFGYNYSHIYRALPRRERDYFRDFSETTSEEERAAIYKKIPENEQALYLARWKQQDANNMREAIKKGLLTEEQVEKSQEVLKELREEQKAEGMPTSTALWSEYLATRLQRESYADWYRRRYLISKYLGGRTLPGPDWCGWFPTTDLEEVKLKVVENLGESAYDYDIWPQQARSAAEKPYLEEAAEELQGTMTPIETHSRIQELFGQYNMSNLNISVQEINGQEGDTIDVSLDQDRENDIRHIMRKEGMFNG